MSAGNFDRSSANRISRVVREVENGWPTNTKRSRRFSAIGGDGSIQIVRLIENVPPAKLYPEMDSFYDLLRTALAERLANTMNEGELLGIGQEIINKFTDDINASGDVIITDRFFGSGLAWMCEFEPGRNREALTTGKVINFNIRFTEVVRVWNMHNRTYNIADNGGAFGNEAGSLGAGFCNVIEGWDGNFWLVSPDKRLEFQTATAIASLSDTVSSLNALLSALINYIFNGGPEPPH